MTLPLFSAVLGLAEFAPSIARFLGGHGAQENVKETAQNLVDIAKKVTGATTPTDAIRLLEQNALLVVDFQKAVLALESDLDFAHLRDRADARARDVAHVTAGKGSQRADIMVCAAALGLILCLGSLGYYREQLPGEAVGIISTIAGIFGACLKDAYAFEFGSSRGSKEKDSTIKKYLSS